MTRSSSQHAQCFGRAELLDFALGKLPTLERDRVDAELQTCENCQRLLETLDGIEDSFVADLTPQPAAPPGRRNFRSCYGAVEQLGPELWHDSSDVPSRPQSLRPPVEHLGQYHLLEQIGEGGMGAVYRARHLRLDKIVAVKILSSGRMFSPAAICSFRPRNAPSEKWTIRILSVRPTPARAGSCTT